MYFCCRQAQMYRIFFPPYGLAHAVQLLTRPRSAETEKCLAGSSPPIPSFPSPPTEWVLRRLGGPALGSNVARLPRARSSPPPPGPWRFLTRSSRCRPRLARASWMSLLGRRVRRKTRPLRSIGCGGRRNASLLDGSAAPRPPGSWAHGPPAYTLPRPGVGRRQDDLPAPGDTRAPGHSAQHTALHFLGLRPPRALPMANHARPPSTNGLSSADFAAGTRGLPSVRAWAPRNEKRKYSF